ncbi:MAG: helix-turn-helix domain-containing protein [Thermoleophilia bacterium]
MNRSDDERAAVSPAQSMLERLRSQTTCTIEQASQLLQIGRSTAYAAAHDGSLPVVRISHRLLVSVPRLLAMLGADEGVRPDS